MDKLKNHNNQIKSQVFQLKRNKNSRRTISALVGFIAWFLVVIGTGIHNNGHDFNKSSFLQLSAA